VLVRVWIDADELRTHHHRRSRTFGVRGARGSDSALDAERQARLRQRGDARAPRSELQIPMTAFELSWRGGATERRLHDRRRGSEELPWSSIDLASLAPDAAEEARKVWTNGVFTEYASAAAFSALTGALLECGAPVDLIAFSADVVVDELFHVELSARLTCELGGAVPLHFDLAKIAPVTTPGVRPLMRAAELAVTTSCVSEALSVPAMSRSRALARLPLVRAVLDRLLADEGAHARIGGWFLEWAELTREEKDSLADLAMATIEVYAPLWQDASCGHCGHDERGREMLRVAVQKKIAAPLAAQGIVLPNERLQRVLEPNR
jgi:hypothetical protein